MAWETVSNPDAISYGLDITPMTSSTSPSLRKRGGERVCVREREREGGGGRREKRKERRGKKRPGGQ